MGKTLTAAYFL